MADSFQGRNFVIAGGSKGIGLELVRQLNSAGGLVHVYSRTTGGLTDNDQIVHHACDFNVDEFDATDMPEQIHGVAYCPGTINLRSFRGLKLEDFRSDFEINVMGAIKFLKACMSGLKKGSDTQPTSAVLFSTVAVGKGLPMHASVATAKGAIEGLTRSIAAEWAPAIRVNCLAPALTDTPLAESFLLQKKNVPRCRQSIRSNVRDSQSTLRRWQSFCFLRNTVGLQVRSSASMVECQH